MKITFAALLAALALLPTGCTTTVNTVEPAQTAGTKQMLADKRVTTDASLNRSVRVVGLNSATGPDGFLKVQVELFNTTRSRHTFTYRVDWFDESGMIITLPTVTAIPRAIEGKDSAFITATAPTDKAKDFRISFIESVN